MAINVELKNEEKTVEKIDFPVLMKSKRHNQIILFTSENTGTCLSEGASSVSIGDHKDSWVSCYDNSTWSKYLGELTLINNL